MRFPNLRYGRPAELEYYAMGHTTAELARMLRRDERTVKDWLSGKTRLPWWVPELMRLRRMEAQERHRQMFGVELPRQLAVVTHEAQLELRRAAEKEKPQAPGLRLVDLRDSRDNAIVGT